MGLALMVVVVNCSQGIETELFDDVVTAVKGVAAAAGKIVCGARKAIEGTGAETGVVVTTGMAERGGEGRKDGDGRRSFRCEL